MKAARRIIPPIAEHDTFITHTAPATLHVGHPLRGSRCILCAQMVGGRPVSFVQLIVADKEACSCGNLTCVSRLICAEHGTPDAEQIITAVSAIMEAHHAAGAHR